MSSLDPSRPEKTNGQRARAASLRSRLHRLRTDVHDVSTRAKSRDVDITIDADATAAVELVYDAYVRRIIDDAKESLATLRRANEAKVRRLTMDVRAFATTAPRVDGSQLVERASTRPRDRGEDTMARRDGARSPLIHAVRRATAARATPRARAAPRDDDGARAAVDRVDAAMGARARMSEDDATRRERA